VIDNKRAVFVLGAGASCPYGYPSGARLRKSICLTQEFQQKYSEYSKRNVSVQIEKVTIAKEIEQFRVAFQKSSIKSIDVFMANNPKLAPVGKYIIAFEVFGSEAKSKFREEAKLWQELSRNSPPKSWTSTDCILRKEDFQGEDWYSYLYNRLIEGRIGKDALPDFSGDKISFITFNYDRSLEHFLYESLCNSFTEISKPQIFECIKKLRIIHVYGKIAPLPWQEATDWVNYAIPISQISEELLWRASLNIKTIYEEKQNPELTEAQNLLKHADDIFFLGFGYAKENMEVLDLPNVIPPGNCRVYGTAFGFYEAEVKRIRNRIVLGLKPGLKPDFVGFKNEGRMVIEPMDCLELLRNHL
jgi:hypothetical protein